MYFDNSKKTVKLLLCLCISIFHWNIHKNAYELYEIACIIRYIRANQLFSEDTTIITSHKDKAQTCCQN